jgi:hypothetical protein
VNRFALLSILVLCLSQAAAAETGESLLFPLEVPGATELFPTSFAGIDGVKIDPHPSSKRTFALELGPKLIELKASYLERRQQEGVPLAALGDPTETQWGRYVDLLAFSSHFGGKLTAEAQAAYSTLGLPSPEDQHPVMTRLGVHGRWGKTGYGLFYRSSGRGFVSTENLRVDNDRDEAQLWGEYDFGPFRLRGAVGELWEKDSYSHEVTLTRNTAASLYFKKSAWTAALSSSYSTAANTERLGEKTLAVSNGVSLAYRVSSLLKLEPNVGFKQEWEPITGVKTDTPSAGLGFSYTPSADLQLVARASYAHNLSDSPLKTGATMNAATGFNWQLGKSFLGNQSMALKVEYKSESRSDLPDHQQANLTAMLQYKIFGF